MAATRLMKRREILEEIHRLAETATKAPPELPPKPPPLPAETAPPPAALTPEQVADRFERVAFLSAVVRGEVDDVAVCFGAASTVPASLAIRIKAAELLSKMNAELVQKVDLKADIRAAVVHVPLRSAPPTVPAHVG